MNCNSLDFVEELDYLVADSEADENQDSNGDEKDDLGGMAVGVEDLPFSEYTVIYKQAKKAQFRDIIDHILLSKKLVQSIKDEAVKAIELYCRDQLCSTLAQLEQFKKNTVILTGTSFWQHIIDITDSYEQ